MPNMNWSELSSLQIGRYAEYYTKMEFASYSFEVYTSEVDDHGIDFIVKKGDSYFEIQVKSVRNSSYVFMSKDKWDISNRNLYLALLLFTDGQLPEIFLLPATAWNNEDDLLKDRDFKDNKSKPEYGLNISKRNRHLLEKYQLEKTIGLLGRTREWRGTMISEERLNEICMKVETEFSDALPFKHRGIMISRKLIMKTIEALEKAPEKSLPQNCRQLRKELTPDGLDKELKYALNTDLRMANIISDVLAKAGVVELVEIENPVTGRMIKGTKLKTG